MKIRAKAKYLPVSPRKIRPIARLFQGRNLTSAISELNFSREANARYFYKLLFSAQSQAKDNDLDLASLRIKELKVDEGARLKRLKIRSRGRADVIKKKTSHISVIIDGKKTGEAKKARGEKNGSKSKS